MNKSISQSNKELIKILKDKKNIPILEAILEQSVADYQKFEPTFNNAKYRSQTPKPKRNELPLIFAEVKAEVDTFLNVTDIKKCKVDYHTFFRLSPVNIIYLGLLAMGGVEAYEPISKVVTGTTVSSQDVSHMLLANVFIMNSTFLGMSEKSNHYEWASANIILEKDPITKLIPILGHEYAHHVQRVCGAGINHGIFLEGHARGVQTHIAKRYAEKRSDEGYLWIAIKRSAEELGSTYHWLCRALDIPHNKYLTRYKKGNNIPGINIKPGKHALGNTLFSIQEKLQGTKIYNDAMHGTFKPE